MYGPAGYFSDEDDFLSDYSDDYPVHQNPPRHEPPVETLETKNKNLHYAIMQKDLHQLTSLLEDPEIHINSQIVDNWPMILLAATVGHFDIVQELISRGADVNSSRDKVTPLMAVCSCPEHTSSEAECLNIVKLLLEKGADTKALDPTRKTALMLASFNGCANIVKELLPHSDINAEDNQEWNALFFAVKANKPKVVEVLIEAGMSIDKTDVRGNDVLFYALFHGDESLLRALSFESYTRNSSIEQMYHFDKMFENVSTPEMLQFLGDIDCILRGVKCEALIDKFMDTNLVDFLSLDSDELAKLGVEIPYQQKRILTGLYKFHQLNFKNKSIPIVRKNSVYSTFDVSKALLTAIRHIVTNEASIRYLIKNYDEGKLEEIKVLNKIAELKKDINKLKNATTKLDALTKQWDSEHAPADLITSNSRKTSRWLKFFSFIGFTSLICITLSRLR